MPIRMPKIRIVGLMRKKGSDFIELQRHGLHDKNSHNNDKSKTLKYAKIVSVVEAVKTAPTLSGAVLCKNLLDPFQRN